MLITRGYGDETVNFIEEAEGHLEEEEDNLEGWMKDEDAPTGEIESEE